MKAVITGATSGIGKEMAIYLSRRGWSLILTGRNAAALQTFADELPTPVETIALDLSMHSAPQQLYRFCQGKGVDLLVNNAGFGVFGAFDESPLTQELEMLDVNIRALHILTKLFLQEFKQRNRGTILNVASSAGFLPGPMLSSYYASKSYVIRLSLAIHEELRRCGSRVQISILCPGPVNTNFNNRAGVSFSIPPASPQYIAKYGIDGALAGKLLLLPTLKIKLAVLGTKLVPEQISAAVAYEIQKRKQKSM